MPLERSGSRSSFASAASSLGKATAKTTYGILLPVSACEVSMMDSMPKPVSRTWRVSRILITISMLSWLTYEAASLSMAQQHDEKTTKDKMELAQKQHIIVKRASDLDPNVIDYAQKPQTENITDWDVDDLVVKGKNYTLTDTTTDSSPRHATVTPVFQVTEPTIEVTTTVTAEVKKQASGTVNEPEHKKDKDPEVRRQANGTVTKTEDKKDEDPKMAVPDPYQPRPTVEKRFHEHKTGTTAVTELERNTTDLYNQTETKMNQEKARRKEEMVTYLFMMALGTTFCVALTMVAVCRLVTIGQNMIDRRIHIDLDQDFAVQVARKQRPRPRLPRVLEPLDEE